LEITVASSIPVLTFHAIDDRPSIISFSQALFERGMRLLYERGYRTVNLVDVADCMRKGLSFPEHSLAITFDDGYQSVYQHAFPILQRYGFSATIFLAVGENGSQSGLERLPSMCERSMLSWREIEEMHKCGIRFGAHTLTHPDLTRLRLAELNSQVYESKAVIEDTLGSEVTCFAYPYGRYDKRCRDVVSRHFLCACSDRLGLVRPSSDPYAVERLDTYYLQTETLLTSLLAGWFRYYVWARAVPRQLRRAFERKIGNRFQW
jgi:peptidoglycan/xylan/chitin deacetylase (PgdA/CDA1 family)